MDRLNRVDYMYYFLQLYFISNHTQYYFFIQKNHTIIFLIDIHVTLSHWCINRFPFKHYQIIFNNFPTSFHQIGAEREFHHQNPIDIFDPKIIIVTCTNSAQLTCRLYVMPNIDFVPPDFISFNIDQPSQNKMYTLHDIPSIFGSQMEFFGVFNENVRDSNPILLLKIYQKNINKKIHFVSHVFTRTFINVHPTC